MTSDSPSNTRIIILALSMFIPLGIVMGRLVELTLVHGAEYRLRADENRTMVRPIRAARGVILDRNGLVLTRNIPIQRMLEIAGDDSGPIPVEDVGRVYPFGKALAHAIGYVGEITKEELDHCKKNDTCTLSPGDVVGKTGLEKQFDEQLRGKDGAELVEVDANGNVIRIEGEEMPHAGKNIQTSLDLGLQQTMTKALDGRRGAAVAMNPEDGSVLGFVSSPAFDPNVFGAAVSGTVRVESNDKAIKDLLTDTIHFPLFNRAISGSYPPGSIFKLVTASAGLSSGKVMDQTTVADTGELKIGDFRYGNWYFDQFGRTEGVLGIARAIARSNDIFFYKVGEWVGPQLLADWAKKFGLGNKTGIDLPGEVDGLVPDPVWKERQMAERWFLGNTYHMAIGQGDLQVTPLQAVVMTAAAVTGERCEPHLSSSKLKDQHSKLCENIGISEEDRSLILDGMVGACSSGGTAFPFFPWNESGDPARVACKTGTAQHGGEKTKPHAWIAVAGPIVKEEGKGKKEEGRYALDLNSKKRIVLVVMLEEAGEGSAESGPVAKEILTEWFKKVQ